MSSSCTLPWANAGRGSMEGSCQAVSVTIVEETQEDLLGDSDFVEPEYSNSNPASYESYNSSRDSGTHHARPYIDEDDEDGDYSSPCPDYEEVDPVQVRQLRKSLEQSTISSNAHFMRKRSPLTNGGLVYNLASEGIFVNNNNNNNNRKSYHRRSLNLDQQEPTYSTVTDPLTRQKIMHSVIYCIHRVDGCTWSGTLGKLKGHLNVCQKDAVDCLNQCGAKIARMVMEDHMLYTCSKRLVACAYCKKDFTGATVEEHTATCGFEPVICENKCGSRIQRNRLRAHMVNTCSKRLINCAYCGKSFTADTLQAHHGQCSRFPLPCPNKCTPDDSVLIAREDLTKHLAEDCTLSDQQPVLSCAYKQAGCNFATSGGQPKLDEHLRCQVKHHLDLMCSLVHKQDSHIRRLSAQLDRAQTSYNGVFVWKIKGFAQKMAEAKAILGDGNRKEKGSLELVSIPFYTSQSGYKLQASLFLNGNGAGEGNHLSVYIKLLPGEYDGILRWPFKHTVSFTLLDQTAERRDAVNIVESFLPDPSWPNFQRPSRQPDQLGFGFPKYVQHDVLQTRNYIKDDSIFIKIRVDPSRNIAV